MSNLQIIEEALQLDPKERFLIVDALLKSLDKPDEELDALWAEESAKRLASYKKGDATTIAFEDIFDS